MRLAITADLHLADQRNRPERYTSLLDILNQILELKIGQLIIAGDLFDSDFTNYSDFDVILSNPRYSELKACVIPGNHDPSLKQSSFVSKNVMVIEEPRLLRLGNELNLLAVPFMFDKSVGEILEDFSDHLRQHPWVLVAHGNYTRGLHTTNPYEPDSYMPITSVDIERHKPRRVFLGHIHSPQDVGQIHLIGSPCGMDITETGKRRFLEYNATTDQVTPRFVNTDAIFQNETLTIYPVEDEAAFIQTQIRNRISAWGLSEGELKKVRLRVKIAGVSADRRQLARTLQDSLANFQFRLAEEPDLSAVNDAGVEDLLFLVERVRQQLGALDWQASELEPDDEDIMVAALQTIYGS